MDIAWLLAGATFFGASYGLIRLFGHLSEEG